MPTYGADVDEGDGGDDDDPVDNLGIIVNMEEDGDLEDDLEAEASTSDWDDDEEEDPFEGFNDEARERLLEDTTAVCVMLNKVCSPSWGLSPFESHFCSGPKVFLHCYSLDNDCSPCMV